MTQFLARTCTMSWWQRFLASLTSKWKIIEFGDGDFVIYQNAGIFGYVKHYATYDLDSACAWCEKQERDSKIKSVTYVMED